VGGRALQAKLRKLWPPGRENIKMFQTGFYVHNSDFSNQKIKLKEKNK